MQTLIQPAVFHIINWFWLRFAFSFKPDTKVLQNWFSNHSHISIYMVHADVHV